MRLQATWEEERTVRSSKSGRLALEEYFRHSRAPFPSKLHALQTAGLRLNLLYLHRQERLLHEQVRKNYWGYDSAEELDNDSLIREQYRGIRPAPGYPACPDHTEKATLFKLLDPEGTSGVTLTEHFAMFPAASVSGWYFSHPQSQYFAVGKITRDQVESYSARKGQDQAVSERWLAPNLSYDN